MPGTSVYVGAVVRQNDRILFVRQSRGHPLEGQWTVPWGRIEDSESPADGAVRETWEEGGVRAEIEGLLGVQELPHPQEGGIALVYMCRHIGESPSRKIESGCGALLFLAGTGGMERAPGTVVCLAGSASVRPAVHVDSPCACKSVALPRRVLLTGR